VSTIKYSRALKKPWIEGKFCGKYIFPVSIKKLEHFSRKGTKIYESTIENIAIKKKKK
jgi:hypothetical protein